MEESVYFHSEVFKLEGLFAKRPSPKGVVVTHPHPLYGGDMHNPVVEAIVAAYRSKGFSTLRFNFRGVGNSRGRYAKGIGERQDVIGALAYLREQGLARIDLAGYSFGAWLNAHLSPQKAAIQRMVMVSPPVAFMDYDAISEVPDLALVVTGSRDEIAPPDLIQEKLPTWSADAQFQIIKGADHFYGGYLEDLTAALSAHL